uniref:Protein regulator of cytokinesis 1 n=1 Tax=Glossina pallidipes TaxID=7398 RepID=A0A1A9ZCE6_GLOPL
MSNKYNKAIEGMQEITNQYVVTLTEIWSTMFDDESCKENLNKLLEHASRFYQELVEQSLTRRSSIEKEINELKKEAEDIKRLLKVEVDLPHRITDTTPLMVIQDELDRSLYDLREQLEQRRAQISQLLAEQALLCDELGERPRPLPSDPLPTPSEMEDFRKHVENLYSEKEKREKKLSTMRHDIKKFLDILNFKLRTEMEKNLLHSRHIKLNKETFENLQHMYDLYGGQVQELKDNIDEIRKKLDTLWERLRTSPNTRSKFRQYTDYNQYTYDAIYSELLRCETLKSQNIKMYVEQLRDEIRDWWDKTLKSDLQRSRFSHFQSTCYTDDLLVLHELELEDLKLYYENNHQLFELYADRNILWDRMQALEAKSSEPGRYNNRGGQLLKEEKERKTIATKLPKIEQQIQQLVQVYEEREHAPFLVYGENIIDVMNYQWEQKRLKKEKLSSARKIASKSRVIQNNASNVMGTNSITKRTPMTLKNASSTLSLRKTPSTIDSTGVFSSQKRKLNPAEKVTPLAKRSLIRAFNSPSVFIKPSSSSKIANSTGKTIKIPTKLKSPLKKNRVIATIIRRQSGRRSVNLKKRRSINSNSGQKAQLPKIIVTEYSTDESNGDDTDGDTYDSFEKCIEPRSRSSTLQSSIASTSTSSTTRTARIKRMQKLANDENVRLHKQQSNRYVTPSKPLNKTHSASVSLTRTAINDGGTAARSGQRSPAICSSNRKLSTKNLPILI